MASIEFKAVANTEVATMAINQWFEAAKQALVQEINDELNDVLQDIKDNYVPIDTGDLRDTGRVIPPKITGSGDLESGIAFGGEKVDYARIQHENLEYEHPHGQAKYIEVPLRRWVESKK
jgi:hypothetical protein